MTFEMKSIEKFEETKDAKAFGTLIEARFDGAKHLVAEATAPSSPKFSVAA